MDKFQVLKNPIDTRDFVQTRLPTAINPTQPIIAVDFTQIPIDNQQIEPDCCAEDAVYLMQYYWAKKTGKVINFSPRFLYSQAKLVDGNPTVQGTFPRAVMGVVTKIGCCTTDLLPNDTTLPYGAYTNVQATPAMLAEAKKWIIPAYETCINLDEQSIRKFLYDHDVIGITLGVGDFSKSLVLPPTTADFPLHRLTLYGNVSPVNLFANSWSKIWGNNGYGSFLFPQFSSYIYDIMAFVDKKTVTITRVKDTGQETQGNLVCGSFSCFTLERPWKNNQTGISCIPPGTYEVKWTFSPRFLRYTYEVQNVLNRTGIRWHKGNFFFDVEGCILLGDGYQDLNADGQLDIIDSTITIKKFEDFMNKADFTLIIK